MCHSGAVGGAVEDAEIGAPWADGIAVLIGKYAADLVQVGQIVNSPGGEQLRKRDGAKRRMASATIKVAGIQIQSAQLAKIVLTQPGKFVE